MIDRNLYKHPNFHAKKMATLYDANPSELIVAAAAELKKKKAMQIPDWAKVVKTGPAQERPPEDPDWWYMRSASILRKVYLQGPIGVSKLRNFYGKKKNRGVKPERFYRAGGKVIRTILQQLETDGLVKEAEKGVHKGKVVTPAGRSFLDTVIRHGPRGTKKAKDAGTPAGDAPESSEGAVTAPATA
jgi:small subunit ribosomal protein S19e